MSDFNRNFRPGGRDGSRFGGGRGFGRGGGGFGGGGDRMMHKAVCANCGKECEVPFRPSGERPVYCSDCFEKRNNEGGGDRRPDNRNFDRPRFDDRRGPPPPPPPGGPHMHQVMDQLRNLNAKMDRLLSVLEPKLSEQKVEEPIAVESQIIDSIVAEPKTKKTKAPKKKPTKEKPQE